ncbi:MAG: cytosine permease [Microcella sp.]|uniref:purine-cytosine permease family protein n=1 Tax=Microcella sp. TaxID=1913979 RepID=UPI0024C535C0|nr:cytosine permease [Microcella sp.]UYN84120.1 MAG: cytosine permease [Microcella sp.]
MVEDELPVNDEGQGVPPEGPRRSTFTPPPAGVSYDPASTDDDALAGALSQQFQRWAPPTAPTAAPEPSAAPVPSPQTEPSATPEPSPQPEPSATPVPSPVAESSSESVSSPAADSSIPPPPQRQSLTDEELLAAADLDDPSHDTGALLDLVERELQLRQREAERLAAWEQTVREQVGPDAEQLVSEVRSTFTGVVPIVAPVAPAPPTVGAPPPEPPPPPIVSAPSGPELDLALADAPPPFGAAVTAVPPPPGSVPAPPELVEPSIPDTGSVAISAPTAFEALLAAADAPTGENDTSSAAAESLEPAGDVQGEPWSLGDTVIEPVPSDEPTAVVDEPADLDAVEAEPLEPARAPRVEQSALEPTPAEMRTGRSIRLFWLWFAVNASVVSVALGAVLLGMGMSLRQSILSALIGVAVSFLPLGLGTLASKWSGQPTMVVSRATFGTAGNAIPVLLAFVTRLVWAGALLWLLGTGVAEVLVGSGVVDGVPIFMLALIVSATGLVIAAVLAGIGFRAIAALGAVVTALGVVLVGGLIALTVPYVDLGAALSLADGPWVLMASGAVLVFSVVGLAWANSSGDIARYQAKATYGSSAVLWSAFGATIPAFALISWGALLAASNPFVAEGLVSNPVDIIARMLPVWYPVPLVLAVGLGLIAAATLALYSGGFALLALGIRSSRPVSVLIVVIVTGAVTAGLALLVVDMTMLFRDVVTTLAVPVAAWAGIFGAETMIRTRRVHSPSLLTAGGVYPRVRWVNTVMLLVITAVGWGFTTAVIAGLQWQGYLWGVLGIPLDSALGASDLGVGVALALGLLTPLVAGIPALRALQTAERAAAEADTPAALSDDLMTTATPSTP